MAPLSIVVLALLLVPQVGLDAARPPQLSDEEWQRVEGFGEGLKRMLGASDVHQEEEEEEGTEDEIARVRHGIAEEKEWDEDSDSEDFEDPDDGEETEEEEMVEHHIESGLPEHVSPWLTIHKVQQVGKCCRGWSPKAIRLVVQVTWTCTRDVRRGKDRWWRCLRPGKNKTALFYRSSGLNSGRDEWAEHATVRMGKTWTPFLDYVRMFNKLPVEVCWANWQVMSPTLCKEHGAFARFGSTHPTVQPWFAPAEGLAVSWLLGGGVWSSPAGKEIAKELGLWRSPSGRVAFAEGLEKQWQALPFGLVTEKKVALLDPLGLRARGADTGAGEVGGEDSLGLEGLFEEIEQEKKEMRSSDDLLFLGLDDDFGDDDGPFGFGDSQCATSRTYEKDGKQKLCLPHITRLTSVRRLRMPEECFKVWEQDACKYHHLPDYAEAPKGWDV